MPLKYCNLPNQESQTKSNYSISNSKESKYTKTSISLCNCVYITSAKQRFEDNQESKNGSREIPYNDVSMVGIWPHDTLLRVVQAFISKRGVGLKKPAQITSHSISFTPQNEASGDPNAARRWTARAL